MRTLVLWCPDWPLTAAGFLPCDPVAVVEAGRVVAASAAAREAGVRAGAPRREAESRCPGLVVVPRDPAQEARAFEPVAVAVSSLTTAVEVTRPGMLSLDARGPARYFGGEEALCERVVAAAAAAVPGSAGPPPRAGVAGGRFCATLAARRGVVVAVGEDAGFLAPFPVAVLDRPELAGLLVRLGVRTLGAFAALPEGAVLARFGADTRSAHLLARGIDEDVLHAVVPAREERVVAELDPPAERAEVAAFAGRALAASLVARLGERGLACVRVRIEAETAHAETLSRLWRADDVLDEAAIVERLRWQLEGWLSGTASELAPTAGIVRLVLVADEVVAAGERQLALWGGASDADRRAARGLDRLRGLLGPDSVLTAVLTGGRGPADRTVFVGEGELPSEEQAARLPWPGRHPLPAPALVHRVPVPAEVAGADGLPVTVSGRGRLTAAPQTLSVGAGPPVGVVDWAGPWTCDERWWDRRASRRCARLQVACADLQAYLLVVEAGRWWVEATYA